MAKPKAAHHRGPYQVTARQVTARAKADPFTRCWRCGRTLAAHPRHKTGRRAFWTAGHVVPGQEGGELRPEASVCNFDHGVRYGNAKRKRRKPRADAARTDLTW